MFRILLGFFLINLFISISFTSLSAQNNIGVINSNNSGIMSSITNPANIADSRFWVDIHVGGGLVDINQNLFRTRFGLGGYIRNDSGMSSLLPKMFLMKDIDPNTYVKAKRDIISNTNFNRKSPQGAYIISDILGPSIMFNLFKRIGFGISTRARAHFNILDRQTNSNFVANYENLLGATGGRDISQIYQMDNFKSVIHRFAELDMTLAMPIMDKGIHFLKAGFTAKRLVGYDYIVFTSLKTTIDFKSAPNSEIGIKGRVDGSFYNQNYPSGNLGDLIDHINYFFDGVFGSNPNIPRGWGFDLGFVYEYRPKYEKIRLTNTSLNMTKRYIRRIEDYTENKYAFRWSIALRDFGYIRYGALNSNGFFYDASKERVVVKLNDPKATIAEALSLRYKPLMDEFRKSLTTANFQENIKKQVNFYLPANFITQIDIALKNKFYLNATLIANLMTRHAFDTRIPTTLSISPRYESSSFDMSIPVIYNFFYNQMKVGLGMNIFQVFYLGSDDIAFLFGGFSGINLYGGLRIPIRKLKPFIRVFDNKKYYSPINYNDIPNTNNKTMKEPIPSNEYRMGVSSQSENRNAFEKGIKQKNSLQPSNFNFRESRSGSNVQSMQKKLPRATKPIGK